MPARLRGAVRLLEPRRLAALSAAACVAALFMLAALAPPMRAWDPDRMLRAAQRRGPEALANARELQQTMHAVAGASEAARVAAINDFFNRHLAYREDIDTWGQPDYWASPLQSLGKGAGDCEDYAIGKYFALTALGIPHARLRLVYVRARLAATPQVTTPHMVLAYYARSEAEPLVLDNLEPAVLAAGARTDLAPVFSFNAEGLWQGIGSIRAQGDPLVRLSRWREVVERAREDGFD